MARGSHRFSGVAAMLSMVCTGVALVIATHHSLAQESDEKQHSKEWKVPARAARRENPIPADAKSIAEGKRLYVAECLDCHGSKGRGDGPSARDLDSIPPNLSDPAMWRQSDGTLFYKITHGREPMPATEEMSEEQRWHLVNYTRTLAPRPPGAGEGKDESAKAES